MNDFKEVLKTVRKQNNLKQKDIAKAMTVSQSYISQIENGNTTPTPMFIKLFVHIYKKDNDTLREESSNG